MECGACCSMMTASSVGGRHDGVTGAECRHWGGHAWRRCVSVTNGCPSPSQYRSMEASPRMTSRRQTCQNAEMLARSDRRTCPLGDVWNLIQLSWLQTAEPCGGLSVGAHAAVVNQCLICSCTPWLSSCPTALPALYPTRVFCMCHPLPLRGRADEPLPNSPAWTIRRFGKPPRPSCPGSAHLAHRTRQTVRT